jgi:hypothetical protein
MTTTSRRTTTGQLISRAAAAALCVGVAYIHVKDQGGIIGAKDPAYMQAGYYALEVTALVVAAMLLARIRPMATWFLTVGVAAGPLVGFVLTRTVGLPNAMDDRGNWTETLGVVSLVVEGALLALATAQFLRSRTAPAAAAYAPSVPTQRVGQSRETVSAAR